MKNWLKKWDLSAIYKVMLVILDVVFVNVSSFLALWVRFNMHMSEIPGYYMDSVWDLVIINTVFTVIVYLIFRLYSSLWRFASIKELVYILEACAICVLFNVLAYYLTYRPIYRSYFVIYGTSLFLLTCFSRFSYRLLRLLYRANIHGGHMRHTMIVGAGETCNVVMKELELSTELDAKICCIIDDNPRKHGTYIHGVKVVGGRDTIVENAKRYGITEIIVAIPSADKREQQKILQICHSQGRVKVEKTKIVENGIQADGIVFMKILYITGNDEMPFYSVDGMIPFSHIIEANGINEDSIFFLQADLEQLSTSMIDSNEIEVKAVISLNVLVLQCENRMIISKVEERPLDMEKIQAMPGITVYVVKNGDSMWDIAKRFYTTVEEICELNELEEDRVVPGMPLLLVKKVEG